MASVRTAGGALREWWAAARKHWWREDGTPDGDGAAQENAARPQKAAEPEETERQPPLLRLADYVTYLPDDDSFTFNDGRPRMPATVGLFFVEKSLFVVRNPVSDSHNLAFQFGWAGPSWRPLIGDWNNDGTETVGLFDSTSGMFYLRDRLQFGYADQEFCLDEVPADSLPVAGDWDGSGYDRVGLFDPTQGYFLLRKGPSPSDIERVTGFCKYPAGLLPIAGDWDGQGFDGLGVYDPSTGRFCLATGPGAGNRTLEFHWGPANGQGLPVCGDWSGTGYDGIGVYDRSTGIFHLADTIVDGGPKGERSVRFGAGDLNAYPFAVRLRIIHTNFQGL